MDQKAKSKGCWTEPNQTNKQKEIEYKGPCNMNLSFDQGQDAKSSWFGPSGQAGRLLSFSFFEGYM